MRGIVGVCLALAMLPGGPAAAQSVYTKGAVKVVGTDTLTGNERRGLAMFKSRARDFNGAFYVSTGADHAEWWVDEHRLEDAKTIAKANCEANDGAAGPCVLYAVIVPAGQPAGTGKAVTNINASLSREMARSSRKGREGTYGAAAANRIGKFGISWGHPSRDAARKEALLACQRSIEKGGGADVYSNYMSAATFNRLLAAGRFDCRVVAEFRK
jgi:hypothetical protein